MVLTPVLDDWTAARELLARLDAAFAAKSDSVSVLLVDDGSSDLVPVDFGSGPYQRLKEINVVTLKKNVGHQRALAIGLCHIAEKMPCDMVVVMDSDGEDEPADAARLVEELQRRVNDTPRLAPIVFAERTHRTEGLGFKLGYFLYRTLHQVLTGRGIRFGNFSVIPFSRLAGLTVEPMLWNHYAASVIASRLPYATIPSNRGRRFAGQSHQSYLKLVIHGLSALSCYNERIGVRMLFFSSLLLAASIAAIVVAVILRLVLPHPLPIWGLVFVGILLVLLFQVITLTTNFTMQIISTRSVQPFLPARDYIWYVARVQRCPISV